MELIVTIFLWAAVVGLVSAVGPARLLNGLLLTIQIAFGVATIPLDAIWGKRKNIFWSALVVVASSFATVVLGVWLEISLIVAIGGILLGIYLIFLWAFANGIAWYLSTLVKAVEGVGTLFYRVLTGIFSVLGLPTTTEPAPDTALPLGTVRIVDHDAFRGQVRKIFGFLAVVWLTLACILTIAPYGDMLFSLPVLGLFGLAIGFIALQHGEPGSIYRKIQTGITAVLVLYFLGAVTGVVIDRKGDILSRMPEAIKAPLRYVISIRNQSSTHIERASLPHEVDSAFTLVEVVETTPLYVPVLDNSNVASFQIEELLNVGTRLATVDPKPKRISAGVEQVIEVLVPDENGEFVNASKGGFVVARKVKVLSPLPQSSKTSFVTDVAWWVLCALGLAFLIGTVWWFARPKPETLTAPANGSTTPSTAGATPAAGTSFIGKTAAMLVMLVAFTISFFWLDAKYSTETSLIAAGMITLAAAAIWATFANEKFHPALSAFAALVILVACGGFLGSKAEASKTQPQPQVVSTQTPSAQTPNTQTRPADLVAIANRHADQYSIERDLVIAIIDTESGWDTNAVSPAPAYAKGLMQLIDDTASRFGVTDPFDPVQNTRGGCEYLRFLLNRYNGDVPTALIGYHSGEGEADKYRGQRLDRVLDQLQPRARQYVPLVLGRWATLKNPGGGPASLASSSRERSGPSQGGQFVRLTPQPATPPAPAVMVTDDAAEMTLHAQQVLTFRLPEGRWRVTANSGPLTWRPRSKAYEPGEHRCGNLYQDYEVAPHGCSADTVIEFDGFKDVVYVGDVIELSRPTTVRVFANGWKKDRGKFPVDRSFVREISLIKEG